MEKDWSRTTKYIVVIVFFAAFLWLIIAARPLIGPLIISFLLAYLLNPVVHLLTQRSRIKREAAAVITYLVFIIGLIAIPVSFTPSIVRQISGFSDDLLTVTGQIDDFINQPIQIGGVALIPPSQAIQSFDQELRAIISQASSGAIEVISGLTTNFLWLLIVFVTTYYLLHDGPKLRNWVINLVPLPYRDDAARLFQEMDDVWSAFLRGQIILVVTIGILTGVSTALLGLRGAIMVGIVAGVLDLIPTLGPMVGGVIAVLLAFIFGSSYLPISNFWFGLLVAAVFLVIQQIENIWIAPQVLGYKLQMHPGLIFVGVIGSLALAGILGALVIVPIMASVAILSRYAYARLLNRMPWPAEGPEEAPLPEENLETGSTP